MCGAQAAAHLAFQALAILSTALDATRLGQPAVDMLMHVVFRPLETAHWCCHHQLAP